MAFSADFGGLLAFLWHLKKGSIYSGDFFTMIVFSDVCKHCCFLTILVCYNSIWKFVVMLVICFIVLSVYLHICLFKPISFIFYRFLRHVPVVYVDYPGKLSLTQIYGTFNRAMLRLVPSLKPYAEPLTSAMVEFYLMSQVSFINVFALVTFVSMLPLLSGQPISLEFTLYYHVTHTYIFVESSFM